MSNSGFENVSWAYKPRLSKYLRKNVKLFFHCMNVSSIFHPYKWKHTLLPTGTLMGGGCFFLWQSLHLLILLLQSVKYSIFLFYLRVQCMTPSSLQVNIIQRIQREVVPFCSTSKGQHGMAVVVAESIIPLQEISSKTTACQWLQELEHMLPNFAEWHSYTSES